MEQEILTLIACPKCKGDLKLQVKTQDTGSTNPGLVCGTCSIKFEILDGIPNLILD